MQADPGGRNRVRIGQKRAIRALRARSGISGPFAHAGAVWRVLVAQPVEVRAMSGVEWTDAERADRIERGESS